VCMGLSLCHCYAYKSLCVFGVPCYDEPVLLQTIRETNTRFWEVGKVRIGVGYRKYCCGGNKIHYLYVFELLVVVRYLRIFRVAQNNL